MCVCVCVRENEKHFLWKSCDLGWAYTRSQFSEMAVEHCLVQPLCVCASFSRQLFTSTNLCGCYFVEADLMRLSGELKLMMSVVYHYTP